MGIVMYQFLLLTGKGDHHRHILLVKQGALALTDVYPVGKEAEKV